MSAIRVSNLTKTFRVPLANRQTVRDNLFHYMKGTQGKWHTLIAVNHLSLTVESGEFFGLVGPNGSGKSTLLRLLAGIYQPDSGTIEITGTTLPLLELGIGFQGELSAIDNIFLSGVMLGLSRERLMEITPEIFAFSELQNFQQTPINHFSAGMKLRLGFALAMRVPTQVLLLDEALLVGDADFRTKCEAEFARLRREGKTIVLASHDLEMMKKWCDRLAYLNHGTLQIVGKSADVIAAYHHS